MTATGYSTWTATDKAIKAAARTISKAQGRDFHTLIRGAYFDRFLSRVFDESQGNRWVLKGGSGMLARVPDTRATKDVDLTTSAMSIDEAERALIAAASNDIGDHAVIRHRDSRPIVEHDVQPDVTGRRITFEMRDAQTLKLIHTIPVDLVVEDGLIGRTEVIDPASRVMPSRGLPTAPYRLYPLSDQIADKASATMLRFNGRPSTRTKDLVDLVVIARTQSVDVDKMRAAIEARFMARREPIPAQFKVPDGWSARYSQMTKGVPACQGFEDVHTAEKLVGTLLAPALDPARPRCHQWTPQRGWDTAPEACKTASPIDPTMTAPSVEPPGSDGPGMN